VLGDADQLRELMVADTTPIQVFGATSDVETVVSPALPNGITAADVETIAVRVRIVPVTETRTFQAGLRLDGADPALDYDVATERILVTLFGSVAELDRLSAVPLVLGVSVGSLGPGSHTVAVAPSLPAGVTVAALSPGTVTVVVRRPQPSPSPTPEPAATTPEPSPEPSASP
jgi:YbbR domain-containing protein